MKVAWFGHKARERGDGLITYSEETTEGLRARGIEVVFFYHGSETKRRDDSKDIQIGSFNLFDRHVISLPGATKIIEETLREEKADVAHASLSFSLLDFSLPDLCHETGLPIVATFHFPYDRRLSLWGGGSRALYRLYALPLAKYDAVIIFSQEQRELLASYGVPAERIRVIPNGVNVESYRPGASTYKDEIGAELLVTYCGRVDPEKNVGILLKVFQELELSPTHKLVVIGEGLEKEKLEDRYARDPRILFIGYIADDAQRIRILQATDIFVLPSEVEGLSLAMLEAMACGLTTIATDVGSDREALAGAGILIDPRELEGQLSLALRLLIDYPDFRRSLGEKARQRAVERYSLDANLERVVELYGELIER